MWSDLIGGVVIVYAWDLTHLPANHAHMAMSLTDVIDTLPLSRDEVYEDVDAGGDVEMQAKGSMTTVDYAGRVKGSKRPVPTQVST